MDLLWPDDLEIKSSRDGTLAKLGGNQLYFVSRSLEEEKPTLLADHRSAITRHILENAGPKPVELMTYNIEQILERRPYSVRTKIEKVMASVARMSNFQTDNLELALRGDSPNAFDLCRDAGLINPGELMSLLKYCADQGWVDFQKHSHGLNVAPTIEGLMRAEEGYSPAEEARACFVAMWFDREMAAAFTDGVEPAVQANGFDAVRIDRREHNNKIDDEIIAEIRRCHFVVADFSCGDGGSRGGVYFEAGFALALGKQVIFTVRKSDLDKVHFDTRQFNHIVWDDPAELSQKLQNRIAATVGKFEP